MQHTDQGLEDLRMVRISEVALAADVPLWEMREICVAGNGPPSVEIKGPKRSFIRYRIADVVAWLRGLPPHRSAQQ